MATDTPASIKVRICMIEYLVSGNDARLCQIRRPNSRRSTRASVCVLLFFARGLVVWSQRLHAEGSIMRKSRRSHWLILGLAVAVGACARTHPSTVVSTSAGDVGLTDGADG